MGIRNAAKAIIIDGESILLNKNENSADREFLGLKKGDIYYDLPGGGQNQYGTLIEAVKRECLEETGYTVSVEKLAAIYEEIFLDEGFRAEYPEYAHKIYFIFLCRKAEEPIQEPTEKDLDMLDSEWVKIDSIKDMKLHPKVLRENIDSILNTDKTLYLGSEYI